MSDQNGSEEFPKKKDQKIHVTVTKDGDDGNDYKTRFEDLEAKMQMMAEQELSDREKALQDQGWRGSIDRTSKETIKQSIKDAENDISVQKQIKAGQGGRGAGGGATLWGNEQTGDNDNRTGRMRSRDYSGETKDEAYVEMIEDLKAEADDPDSPQCKEAQKILNKMFSRAIRQSVREDHVMEFQGGVKPFAGREILKKPTSTVTQEDIDEEKEKTKRKMRNWKRK